MQHIPNRTWRMIGAIASVVIFVAALYALHHVLAEVHLNEVLKRLSKTSTTSIFLALMCTAGSYFLLTGYDVLALRQIGKALPYQKAALGSFISYTFGNTIGLSLLTGGSIRYRVYAGSGLSAAEIAMLTGICAFTFGLGVFLLLGIAMVLEPGALSEIDAVSPTANRIVGVLLLLALALYLAAAALRHRPLQIRGWSMPLPNVRIAAAQTLISAFDISLAAAALYFVLPPSVSIGFPAFLGLFVAAATIGVISHSPGGLGVFEAVMLLALPGTDESGLLGALLIYRCMYYLLPLIIAAALLSWNEFRLRRESLVPALRSIRGLSHAVSPAIIGVMVFVGGAILLFSAATPAVGGRMTVLHHILPLPFIEASHLLSSVLGFWLMILARGLFRRLDGAYYLTIAVLSGGIVFSILKGIDYEEAIILGAVLIMLLATHQAFYRKASLLRLRFSAAWIATIAVVVLGSIWLGIFAFKHVEYSSALWWEFAYHGDAPRFLRASITVSILTVGLLLYVALRPSRPNAGGDYSSLPLSVPGLVAASRRIDANLALTGDKRIFMAADERAFIMYQVKGSSWIAMGEPVGDESEWESLLWPFREMCDRHGGYAVFYQVGAEYLPVFLDLGLSLLKIGEEARVDLERFSLDGSAMRDLRYIERRATKEGATFEIVPAIDVPAILPELRRVSDNWLEAKSTHEKGFSVGAFSEGYLALFDCAVVRRDGEIVAFANIWKTAGNTEISVDLMRYSTNAPYGIMDYLFIRLMLWGKEHDIKWFNLGMAPLSGLDRHPLAPVWTQLGAFIFRHGEHFYNFEGLRSYKEKFAPVWQPKYIASPGGLALPRILLDIASLISGGTKEILLK